MGLVFSDIDTLLLGYFVSTGEVGVYRVVYPLGELMLVFLNSFSFMFLPFLSGLHADGDFGEMKRIYQAVTKWLFVLTFPVFLAWTLFPGVVIKTFFGSEYVGGSPALAVLGAGFFVHASIGLNSNTITSIGETKLIPIVNLIAAVINVGLNLVLIPRYSVFGAAVATAVSYFVLNVLFSVLLYRMTGIHPFGRPVVRVAVSVTVVSVAFYLPLQLFLESTARSVVIAGVLFLPIYAATVLFAGGVTEAEKELIGQIENRLGIDSSEIRERVGRR
jgi:O-antigen/teichoic acid export membrane protein